MTMTNDSAPNYEVEGIRLANTITPFAPVTTLLELVDELRSELAGKELELSVLRRGNAPKYSEAERRVLYYALALAQAQGVRQVDGFHQGDHEALVALVKKVGPA
jgi:hypothetical protein